MSDQWVETTLRDVCRSIKRGKAPKYVDEGRLVLNQKCVRDENRINFSLARRTDLSRAVLEHADLRVGDVLINSTGRGTLGRAAELRELPEPATADSHVTIVRPDPERFALGFAGLALSTCKADFESLQTGSTNQTELPASSIASLSIVLPPIPTQERIVELIDAVDDQITALDGEAEAATRVRGGLLDEFTGAASSDTKPLGELCPVIGSGPSWAAKDESSVPSEGAWTILKITNTRPDGSIDLSELAYVVGLPARTKVIGPTSLVMIRTNGNRKRIGNVYLPPEEVHGAAVSAFQFILDAADVETRDYLYVVLRSPRIQHQMSDSASGSTGLGNLAVRWLKTLEIPWPDAEMREVQVKAVQAIDAKIAATRAEADHLRSVRRGLLLGLLDRTVDIESAELEV